MPSLQDVNRAIPSPPVTTEPGDTTPVPLVTANVTVAPDISAPLWFRTLTPGGSATNEFAAACCDSALTASIDPGATMPVAVNVTVGSPLTVAVSVFVPGVEPSVQLVTRATPSAPVTTDNGPAEPPPPVTAKETVMPGTGLPS
jgi:hypothetical protein